MILIHIWLDYASPRGPCSRSQCQIAVNYRGRSPGRWQASFCYVRHVINVGIVLGLKYLLFHAHDTITLFLALVFLLNFIWLAALRSDEI